VIVKESPKNFTQKNQDEAISHGDRSDSNLSKDDSGQKYSHPNYVFHFLIDFGVPGLH
jgi:hypothetical protein